MNSLILDVAHGINTPGKQSPDGRHKEWIWSRETARKAMHELLNTNDLNFHFHCPYLSYENEPGLTKRVQIYNQMSKTYDRTLVLPLHNDAAPLNICDNEGWCSSAHGIAFWTSRGETPADKWATFMYNRFKILMPDEHFRTAYWLGEKEKIKDPDYEANFTVLAGNKYVKPLYEAILMEVLFQTNKKDVEKLLSEDWNDIFVSILVSVIVELFNNIDTL